jgi:putative chitinase
MLNRKAFFNALRGGAMFPKGFTPEQVDGIDNLLNVWERYFAADSDFLLAYNLGTAWHETAGTMQPITERGTRSYFDKYEPGTKLGKVLGNTAKGDGFRFRGEGHVQNTGRANAAKATKRINELFHLGVDLVANPSKRGDPFISAISLFLGNKEGWWTGKDLLDFIDGIPESEAEDLREFVNARRVVNGTDKADKIARHGMDFYKALQAARKMKDTPFVSGMTAAPMPTYQYQNNPVSSGRTNFTPAPATSAEDAQVPPPAVIVSDVPLPKGGLWSALARLAASIFKGKAR